MTLRVFTFYRGLFVYYMVLSALTVACVDDVLDEVMVFICREYAVLKTCDTGLRT